MSRAGSVSSLLLPRSSLHISIPPLWDLMRSLDARFDQLSCLCVLPLLAASPPTLRAWPEGGKRGTRSAGWEN